MNSNLARTFATLALGVLALFAVGCGDETVLIGAVLPLTGDDSVYGDPVRKGIELAYEEIQAAGQPIDLQIVDSESDPEKAKELLRQQFDERGALVALGGVTSAEAKAMIAVAERSDKILMSPTASAPELSGLSRSFYRIFPSDFAAAGRMAQFVSQDLDVKVVVVIAEGSQEYARGIQGAFQSAYEGYGGQVEETLEFPPNTVDFSGFIDRVMTVDPPAVYITAYGEAVGQILKELRGRGYKGKILTTSAFASPRFIVPAGAAATGVILTQSVFELDSQHAHIKTFVDKYKAKYGEDPDIFAAHGYDALRVIAAAIDGRPALTSEVPKGLRDIEDFLGVTGSIQFNEKGDVLKYPRVYIIDGDGVLNDYGKRAQKQREELKSKREELKRKLDEIQRKAKEMGG